MATAKQQETLLLTEHFTWPPISLIDDIINTINEVLYRCTQILDTELSSLDPAILGFQDRAQQENRTVETDQDGNGIYPEAKLEIEEGVLKLETLVENAVDKNFDKLEIWTLRNVFALGRGKGAADDEDLASWIRLGHYENIQSPSNTSPTITPESLISLRRKLQETQKLHAALLAEKTRNEAQIQKLKSLLQPTPAKREPRSSTSPAKTNGQGGEDAPFAFLTHNPAAQNLGIQSLPSNGNTLETRTQLSTHTSFTTSQLPHLRQLLGALKPHLATTALPMRNAGDAAELSKERKVYIESQSKRILERRGVDTAEGVEGSLDGPRKAPEEVRGLEGLVQNMGGDDAMDTS